MISSSVFKYCSTSSVSLLIAYVAFWFLPGSLSRNLAVSYACVDVNNAYFLCNSVLNWIT